MPLSSVHSELIDSLLDPSTHADLALALAEGSPRTRLALASAVSRTAHASGSQATLPAWRLAVSAMRDLTPALVASKGNGSSGSASRVAVETYAALYALAVAEHAPGLSAEAEDAQCIAADTMRAVMSAPSGAACRRGGARGREKESSIVIEDADSAAFLDRVIFPGASALGWSRLLPSSSGDGAAVVVPALLARIRAADAPLSERIAVARVLLLPWIKFTETAMRRKTSDLRSATAYTRKARLALLRAAEGKHHRPPDALRARFMAANLFSDDPVELARTVHRAANSFLRSSKARDYGVVVELYCNALLSFQKLLGDDTAAALEAHKTEEVSAWFDHFYVSCFHTDDERYRRKAASLVVLRADILSESDLSCAVKTQRILVEGGLYVPDAGQWTKASVSLERAASCAETLLKKDMGFKSQAVCSLRILRVLESVRSVLCVQTSTSFRSSDAAVHFLQVYVRLFQAATNCAPSDEHARCRSMVSVYDRVNGMTGAALSTCEALLRLRAASDEKDGIFWAMSECASIVVATKSDIAQWAKWLAIVLNNTGIDLYNRHVKGDTAADKEMMEAAGSLMERSANWLAVASYPPSDIDLSRLELGVFPAALETQALRCCKRLAFSADSFLAAGNGCLLDSLRAAIAGLLCCVANEISPLPPEISVSFARSAADAAERRTDNVRDILQPLVEDGSPSRALDAAFEAVQRYRINSCKKLSRSEVTRVYPLPREEGLLLFLCELFEEATSCVSYREDEIELAYRKARVDVVLQKTDGSSAARDICSRFKVSDSLRGSRRTVGRRSARGRDRGGDASQVVVVSKSVGIYVLLCKMWEAIECLDYAVAETLLKELEERVPRSPLEANVKRTESPSLCEFILFDILEIAGWAAFVLARQDADVHALRFQELSHHVCFQLNIPDSAFDVADTYRRLGVTHSCWSVLRRDETSGYGESVAVHARVLNDLARYGDTEVVAKSVQDARSFGAWADAALYGRGDISAAMTRTKVAMKLLIRTLSSTDESTVLALNTLELFRVAGVTVCVPRIQSPSASFGLVYNRSRNSHLCELVHCLARLAMLFDRMDNVRDAQYYADKCTELSKQVAAPGLELSCKYLSDRIPRGFDEVLLPLPEKGWVIGYARSAYARNAVTTARLLGESILTLSNGGLSSATSGGDALSVALDVLDHSEACLEKAETDDEVNEDILSLISAKLLTSRGQCLLLANSLPDSLSAFQLALEVSPITEECRLEALVGMAETQLRLGQVNDAIATLNTSKRTVAAENVALPRLVKRMWRLFAEAGFLSLGSSCDESSAIADSLAEVHGSSLGLRHSLNRLRFASESLPDNEVSSLARNFSSLGVCTSATARLRSALSVRTVLTGLSLSLDSASILLWQVTPSREAFALRLPIPSKGLYSYAGIQQRMKEILSAMKAMTIGDGILSAREKQSWWKKRFGLDHELGQLMVDVEEKWLGDARAFLLPSTFCNEAAADCTPLLASFGAAAVHYPELISPASITSVLDRSFSETENQDNVSFIESMLAQSRVESAAVSVATGQQKKQTRQASRKKGRKVSPTGASTTAGELLLAIDTDLGCLPWECLPVLRTSKCGVSRLPHESFLLSASQATGIDPSSVFYMLNPSGDLSVTQSTFQSLFESQYGWTGSVGAHAGKSDVDDNLAKLELSDVFLYCGHGGGEAVVPPRRLATSASRVPISILMGCSSGRLERYSAGAESGGTAIEYLLAGSPAVVANMWDVSDRDIDRLTGSLLENWLGISTSGEGEESLDNEGVKPERCSLAVALARSRDACRLPFLVGAATVLYGNGMFRCDEDCSSSVE